MTFEEIHAIVRPAAPVTDFDYEEKEAIAHRVNGRTFATVDHMLYEMGFNPGDWTPQKRVVIGKQLGLPYS